MRRTYSISNRLRHFGLLALFALSGHVMAATTNLGLQTAQNSLTYTNSFLTPQNQFYDDYLFAISPASVNSITSTISLGSMLGINNLQASLYSGMLDPITGLPSGSLLASSTVITVSASPLIATIDLISPITLSTGNYVLQITGSVIGTAGGSYSGVLNISPVPEAAEWAMLLIGLCLMGFVAVRRRPSNRVEVSELHGVYHEGAKVIGSFIHALSWDEVLRRITVWSKEHESRYVCICNVHSVITASHNEEFRRVLRHADIATPDGMPVAWMLRRLGFSSQERINGPDLMWKYCKLASRRGEKVYFYGSTFETLCRMSVKLRAAFPGLQIGGIYSPPFNSVVKIEDDEIVASINESGAGVVFVSLGCPKQEKWMAAHHNRINAVMIGVGAAFDYHAGTIQRAPLWMQRNGLEWAHRLISDPQRLWKRYFVTNSIFIVRAILQLLKYSLRNVSFPRFATRRPAFNVR